MGRSLLLAVLIFFPGAQAGSQPPEEKPPALVQGEGRVIYANDDDWDWASPLGIKEPCKLSVYGKMSWSALDWMEEGLTEVRGVLIGQPPLIGEYLTMGDLNRMRQAGPKCSYEHLGQRENLLRDLMKDKVRPNIIILMEDSGPARPHFSTADGEACWHFVQGGGRLLVLDDWRCYQGLIAPFLDPTRVAPKKPREKDPLFEKNVLQKIVLLRNADYKVREKAFLDLSNMGTDILPLLEKVEDAPLELNRRIERLKEMLQPTPPFLAGGDWMLNAYKAAAEFHPLVEMKTILRDGSMSPGGALCLRLLPRK